MAQHVIAMTSLSVTANQLRDFIQNKISDLTVFIGQPKVAFATRQNDEKGLNLFFYKIDQSGYPADSTSADPVYMRLFCLMTPICPDKDDEGVVAGENDLRVVGEVVRVFHENPLIVVTDPNSGNQPVAELQAIPHPMSLDDINHIWSTQGDVQYKVSVAFEFALMPVPLRKPVTRGPLVGALGVAVSSFDDPHWTDRPMPQASKTKLEKFDPYDNAWSPKIGFPVNGELLLARKLKDNPGAATVDVLVTCRDSGNVRFLWDVWQHVPNQDTDWSTAVGWTDAQDQAVSGGASGQTITLTIPTQVQNGFDGQALLYAVREYQRPVDQKKIYLKSNPLLVSIYPANEPDGGP